MPQTKRQQYEILRSQLENERASYLSDWRDIGEYIMPRRPRFNTSDVNKGGRRNQKIIDSTATMAARTLRSGMMSGITSPARPWFRLTTPDPGLAEHAPVKDWLYFVSQRMSTKFLKSNLYNVLPIIYGDLGVFATGAMFVEEDFEDTIRCYPFPIGSYMISTNAKLKVDVFFREFRMTVRQLVNKFGRTDEMSGKINWDNFSTTVKTEYDNGNLESWIDVCHVIQPNEDYDPKKILSKFKKYSSCYYEKGSTSNSQTSSIGPEDNKFLSEKGYDFFPVMAPRWEVTGEDSYGTDSPGIVAIGDTKALQLMHKRKAQAVEKMVNPPMVGPSSLKTQKSSILPGDITYLDSREGQQGFRPAHEVQPRIQELLMDIQDHQKRISRAFYEDLFLMLSQSDRRDITAREIDERHEEKLLALGPVLEQLNQDLLDPLIDNTFEIMMRQGDIPPPPDELQGVGLKVEYISVMAQAQKLIGISGIERFSGFVGQVVAQTGDQSVMQKVDLDQLVDVYGEMTSIPPGIVRTDDQVAAMRAEIAKQQQAQQRAQMMEQAAGAAKNLAQAPMDQDSALTRLVDQANAGNLVQ